MPYMQPEKGNLCQHKNVSSWLYHAGVEINSLLNFQFTLNKDLASECKQALTDQLCYSGLRCHTEESTGTYLKQMEEKCITTVELW